VNEVERLSDEATRLITEAEVRGIVLRALGSVGVRLHCPPALESMVERERLPKDIDLVTRREDRRELRRFFEGHGYVADRDMLVAMEGTRYLFRHPGRGIDVDVWVDVLDLCHRLDVAGRMGPGPTLSIEDLVLSKLQIVELTANDIDDLACMFSTHELGDASEGPEVIDIGYICTLLGDDWGFWRTATDNLDRIAPGFPPIGRDNADALLALLAECPKTLRWKIRSRVGERVQWWQEVDIPRDTY
jgi:hypothetical protein